VIISVGVLSKLVRDETEVEESRLGANTKRSFPAPPVNESSPTSPLSAIASITACDDIIAVATGDIISPNTTIETVIPAAQINYRVAIDPLQSNDIITIKPIGIFLEGNRKILVVHCYRNIVIPVTAANLINRSFE
jgi:hypothetical protein